MDNDDDFFITQSGQLYFASPPNYEDQTSYLVTITAADDDPIVSLSGSLSITVTVTDVEEPGVVTITPLRGWIGTRFEAELIDGDGSVTGETWKWERSRNRSSWEEITAASQDNYIADGDDVGHYLRATVSYSDRRGGNKEAVGEDPVADRRGPTHYHQQRARLRRSLHDPQHPSGVGQGTSCRRAGASRRPGPG